MLLNIVFSVVELAAVILMYLCTIPLKKEIYEKEFVPSGHHLYLCGCLSISLSVPSACISIFYLYLSLSLSIYLYLVRRYYIQKKKIVYRIDFFPLVIFQTISQRVLFEQEQVPGITVSVQPTDCPGL